MFDLFGVFGVFGVGRLPGAGCVLFLWLSVGFDQRHQVGSIAGSAFMR
jgi:hypothetical protein